MNITIKKASNLINKSNGKIFTVTFAKKDGTLREMNCRTGVKAHQKGGTLKYNPKDYGLVSVFDLQSAGYRMINIKGIKTLSIGGDIYFIKKA